MKRIAIVGAGQSGMQLALGLLGAGCMGRSTVVSNRTAQEIRQGPVMSSQCMFETALQAGRELGIDWWDDDCPPVEGIGLTVPGPAAARPSTGWPGSTAPRSRSTIA